MIIRFALSCLYRSWSAQIQIAIDPDIAMSEGVNANWQRLIFMLLLALIYGTWHYVPLVSLLMGALLVIPALSARLLAHSPKQMVIWAFILAQFSVTVGLVVKCGAQHCHRFKYCIVYGALFCSNFYRSEVRVHVLHNTHPLQPEMNLLLIWLKQQNLLYLAFFRDTYFGNYEYGNTISA